VTNCGATEIGKFYVVPCVKSVGGDAYWKGEWVPVIGPEHEDAEHINFPASHWHVDLRFASARMFKRLCWRGGESSAYIFPLQRHKYGEKWGDPFIEGGVVLKRRKCMRQWPEWPRSKASWMPKLETAYACSKLKGMVCPHRGIPLAGASRDGDVVTCPGHGLRWNVVTGELVRGLRADSYTTKREER
jgi:hypothetical protein